jgi:hypothetical protein
MEHLGFLLTIALATFTAVNASTGGIRCRRSSSGSVTTTNTFECRSEDKNGEPWWAICGIKVDTCFANSREGTTTYGESRYWPNGDYEGDFGPINSQGWDCTKACQDRPGQTGSFSSAIAK